MPPRPRSSPTNAHRRTLELGHRVLSRLQRREVREALPGELHFVFSRLVARRSSRAAVPPRAPPRGIVRRCCVITAFRRFRHARRPIQTRGKGRRLVSEKKQFEPSSRGQEGRGNIDPVVGWLAGWLAGWTDTYTTCVFPWSVHTRDRRVANQAPWSQQQRQKHQKHQKHQRRPQKQHPIATGSAC